jgi:hypothetical protein
MPTTIVVQNDFKYAVNDWRLDQQESFQMVKGIHAEYVSSYGRLSGSQETTTEWEDAPAVAPADPLTYPPYRFADGTWRKDPAYTLQATLVRTVTYQPTGPDAYQVTTVTLDPLTGETTTDVQNFSGMAPQSQTINTSLTSLVVQPTFGTLTDDCLSEFVDSKASLNLKWAETAEELSNSARRAMQRDSAIIRSLRMAANPQMQIGDTVRLVVPKRDIDALHLLTGRTITRDCDTGDCTMALQLEFWIR